MNILLCASKTPDTTSKITFTGDGKALDGAGVQYILNPYDDHALARAMEIKEKTGGKLTVMHVGDSTAEPILRRCLAIGADDAVLITGPVEDAYQVAAQLAGAAQGKGFDLVMTGRESIDYNGNSVCDMLGEMLGILSVSYVTHLETDGKEATISRFIDGGEEKIAAMLPLVISATKELAEPRIPNMRGIMQARTKPIATLTIEAPAPLAPVVKHTPPAKKTGVTLIPAEDAASLIDRLHNDNKVI